MPERFTETMRAASEAGWSHAVQHRFVNELFAGAVPNAVMARYLIQDHRFLDSFLVLLGAALASADTFAARLRLWSLHRRSHAMHDSFAMIHWSRAGISPGTSGILWSLSIAAEVVVFLLVGRPLLDRIGPAGARLVSMAALRLRSAARTLAPSRANSTAVPCRCPTPGHSSPLPKPAPLSP
jgi:TENA/THI-4/PQQC family